MRVRERQPFHEVERQEVRNNLFEELIFWNSLCLFQLELRESGDLNQSLLIFLGEYEAKSVEMIFEKYALSVEVGKLNVRPDDSCSH